MSTQEIKFFSFLGFAFIGWIFVGLLYLLLRPKKAKISEIVMKNIPPPPLKEINKGITAKEMEECVKKMKEFLDSGKSFCDFHKTNESPQHLFPAQVSCEETTQHFNELKAVNDIEFLADFIAHLKDEYNIEIPDKAIVTFLE